MKWICCEHLQKEYGSGESKQISLSDVCLEITRGEFVAVTGKSGSGKSTLLNMIGLIDRPTSGSVSINGQRYSDCNETQRALARSRMIGYVFQSFYLEPNYTVLQNIEIPLLITGVGAKQRLRIAEQVLETVGLRHKLRQKVSTLSGGEKQRVCIARALSNDPELILADEPCGNLDSGNSALVMDLLEQLHRSGKTVLLVTHNPEDAKRAQRMIIMKDGKIEEDQTL